MQPLNCLFREIVRHPDTEPCAEVVVTGQGIVIAQALRAFAGESHRQPGQNVPEISFQHGCAESVIVLPAEFQPRKRRTAAAQSGIGLGQIVGDDIIKVVAPHVQFDFRQGFFVGIRRQFKLSLLVIRIAEPGEDGAVVKIRGRFSGKDAVRLLQVRERLFGPVQPKQGHRQIRRRDASSGGIGVILHQFQRPAQTAARPFPLFRLLAEQRQVVPEAGNSAVCGRQQSVVKLLHSLKGGKGILVLPGGTIGVGAVQQGGGVGNAVGVPGVFEQGTGFGGGAQRLGKLAAVPVKPDLLVAQELFAFHVLLCLRLGDGLGKADLCLVQFALVQQGVQTGKGFLYLHGRSPFFGYNKVNRGQGVQCSLEVGYFCLENPI